MDEYQIGTLVIFGEFLITIAIIFILVYLWEVRNK
jgi:hypothetical protein